MLKGSNIEKENTYIVKENSQPFNFLALVVWTALSLQHISSYVF